MLACASNMCLFTQYFQRPFFGASWTDTRAQESRACQLWPVWTVVHRLGAWGVGVLNMPARASNMYLFTKYLQRALFGPSWTDTRAQESRACQLWPVRMVVHRLGAGVGVLNMPARASNMCLLTQYFQRFFFGASWKDARAQESRACQLWSVRQWCTDWAHVCGCSYYSCTCVKYVTVYTIFSGTFCWCVLDGRARAGEPRMPTLVCTDGGAQTGHVGCWCA
jgi:hypothetical protein